MSQPSTVLNGPSDGNQTAQTTMVKPTSIQDPPRPQLNRVDSRANLSPRTGYPQQQFRPNQQRPPFPGTPPQFPRPQLQRNPSFGQVNSPPPIANIRPGSPNPTGLRQPPPFTRPPLSPGAGRPPGLFQQKSVPKPPQEIIPRSQTLDTTTELNTARNAMESQKALYEEESKNEVNKKLSNEGLNNTGVKVQEEENSTKLIINETKLGDKGGEVERDQKSPAFDDKGKLNDEQKISTEKVKIKSPIFDDEKVALEKIDEKEKPNKAEKSENLEKPEKPKTLRPDSRSSLGRPETFKSEGDNDSGVDESTQGNDQSSNGDHNSPRKSTTGKPPSRNAASPTKSRSVSRGSKSPHVKTPDSPTPSTPGSVDKKKVPMNKVQVGGAPSPNLKEVKSKIGSLQNTSYKPGGGQIKIENKKIDLSKAHSKIAAKNDTYVPGGGEKKIEHRKLNWNASSKIGSLDNTTHKPKGGDKKIESMKLDFKDKAKPKVGSKDNMKYQPGGGDVKTACEKVNKKLDSVRREEIETKKLDIKAKSKVNSLDNVKHRPGGGDKKIFDDKEYLRQKSGTSGDHNSLNGSQSSLPSQDAAEPISDENLNRE
nr:microtubule-associated protein tau-like isoform X1 [Onthophagus taurus]